MIYETIKKGGRSIPRNDLCEITVPKVEYVDEYIWKEKVIFHLWVFIFHQISQESFLILPIFIYFPFVNLVYSCANQENTLLKRITLIKMYI